MSPSVRKMIQTTSVALTFILAVGSAQAVEVGQKDRTFSVEQLKVKVGQSVVFVNDDTAPHNIYITNGDSKDDKGLQKPGERVTVPISSRGEHKVKCAIHPKMKMTIVAE